MGLILWPDSGDATATPVNINSDFTVNTRFMALNSVPITPPKKEKEHTTVVDLALPTLLRLHIYIYTHIFQIFLV